MSKPSTHDLLKARLFLVRSDLDDAIGRLTPEMMPWAPSPGMRTISGQLLEIVGTEMQVLRMLKEGKTLSDEKVRQILGEYGSLTRLQRALADVRQETLEYIDSFSPEQLDEPVEVPTNWFESLGLPAVPRSEVIRSIAQHEWYHTAQLVSYLWSLGDNPYSWR